MQNLASFVAQFFFFVGFEFAVIHQRPSKWQHVERNRARKLACWRKRHGVSVIGESAYIVCGGYLVIQLGDASYTPAADCLVGAGR